MTAIEIPFSREMARAALDGYKVATTRSEKKGEIGDTFTVANPHIPNNPMAGHFRLIEVIATDLETVANIYFRLEGFDSPAAFRATWRALHRGHYTTDKVYYLHIFGRIV